MWQPVNDEPEEPAQPGAEPPRPPERRLRAVDGDAYADWDEIYADNVVRLYRLIYSKVGNRPDAEDLTAEVFLAALGPLRLSVSRGEVRAYLLRTAQTVLASFWRRRLGSEVTTIDLSAAPALPAGGPTVAPGDEGGGGSTRRARQILDALPDRYRRVLELRFVEGRSVRDAAQAMGVTVANAKVLQHRALRLAATIPEVGP